MVECTKNITLKSSSTWARIISRQTEGDGYFSTSHQRGVSVDNEEIFLEKKGDNTSKYTAVIQHMPVEMARSHLVEYQHQ